MIVSAILLSRKTRLRRGVQKPNRPVNRTDKLLSGYCYWVIGFLMGLEKIIFGLLGRFRFILLVYWVNR